MSISFAAFFQGAAGDCQCPACKLAIAAAVEAAPNPALAAAFLNGAKMLHVQRRTVKPSKTPELQEIADRHVAGFLRYGRANGLAF